MTAYSDFLSDPLRKSIYLAEVHYGNPADSTSGVLYYSTSAYGTAASDTPASQRFDARMATGYNFASTAGEEEGLGTVEGLLPARRGGTLNIVQKLGDLDALADWSFDGRQVVIRHGGTSPRYGTLAYADFKEVFNGTVEGQPLIGVDEVTFQLANKDALFEHPIQTRTYRGGTWCVKGDGAAVNIDCGTGSTFNFTSGAFTVEFWIYVESYPGTETSIINRGAASTDGWAVRLGTAGAIRFATNQSGAAQTTISDPIVTNKWTHVAVVRSGAAATIYLDGVAANVTSATHVNPTTSTRNLYFLRNDAGSLFLNAFLDDVRISNVAQLPGSIATRMNRQLTAAEIAGAFGFVGYWKLDEGTGTNCNDETATGADGTLSSSAAWARSLQGGEELESATLPDVWGARFGVPPVLVDAASRVYQVHSGPINSIVGVYEGGSALTLDPSPGTTYSSLTTFLAATTAASQYEVCSTDYGSWIRLGSNPSKPVTIDIQGDKSGGTYRSKASDIWRYIVCNRGPQPLTDPDDIDDTAFDTAATDVTAAVGIDYSTEISIAEVGQFLLAGVGLSTWFQRDGGLLTIQRFEGATAGTAVLDLTEQDVEIGTLEPLAAGAPIWGVDLGWKKNSLVHSTTDIAAAVIGGTRWAFLLKEWRIIGAYDSTVRAAYQGAGKLTLETGLGTWEEARAEADRRLALFAGKPQGFKGFFRERATQLDRFDTVTFHFRDADRYGVQQSRFGTSATAKFIVLAAEDDTAKGGTWLTLYREAIA